MAARTEIPVTRVADGTLTSMPPPELPVAVAVERPSPRSAPLAGPDQAVPERGDRARVWPK